MLITLGCFQLYFQLFNSNGWVFNSLNKMSFHVKCTQRLGIFYLQELCKDNKTKGKSTMILHMQLIVSYCKLPCMCTCAWEHCGNMHYDRTLLEGSYYLLL